LIVDRINSTAWWWLVVYSGDANNVAATSAYSVETFTITNQ
jgi:hypothetical protein